ncbi:hypothetical protein TSAR_003681 [Trichomalopsis sarcophagae]|uniref:Uncharacterized protein n=1 Tax=Trichomalopsis sarcophagae TaxID=543379 RepID=A0A232EZY0_9HYME|nr:hypothetical protein TSAR_003681 [Trichomalopsis sarcophagae]
MASLQEVCKKWINCTQQLDFEPILESIQDSKNIKRGVDSDKFLFKFLLHLSHSAERCNREKLCKETQIFTIAKFILENLTTVPDKNKLFSAIYYILFYFLNKQHFKEAEIINSYLLPGKIMKDDDFFESSKYYQIASLWYLEIFKKIDEQADNYKAQKDYSNEDISTYIQFHFQILKHCDETSRYYLVTFDTYMKKLCNYPLDIASTYMVLLFEEISNYISNLKKLPVTEAYNVIIPVVGIVFYKRNDAINNKTILECFQKCDSHFLIALRISSQCYNSYKLFREHSLNILETNFMTKEFGEARFKRTFDILRILLDKYGIENESVANTVTGLACSFETLFNNWEGLVSDQSTDSKIFDDILKMGEFVKFTYGFLKNRLFPLNYKCRKCPITTKCPMKKDIYNANLVFSAYLRLIAKFKSNNLNEKTFALAKDMIEEMLLGFNELDKSGCKFSASMWDSCARSIFNVGLVCEALYPAQYEGLFEVLCRQIVKRDGLLSKLSSFGLESPVGTTLQRLCNVNFEQGNYRKAMSYTAYNAVVSTTESRKKKAYDMWCTIKLKCSDSQEFQELTLVNCLKTSESIAKNVGIDVNLEQYSFDDLSAIYLQELKYLFPVKGNLLISMQKSLAELESTKNDLYYARGVLLLCFHSLQHSKRKYIIEYITKAIKKLNAIKPRKPNIEMLKASLTFFNILEKLYAKRQAITKQMDDANFTVKSFKTLRGKQIDDEIEEQDEIVPTYGNINIEEDKKCAKELKDVLNTWDNCIQKDLTAVVKDWEPEYTLETVILCGEYCRLFKFNHNEEQAWKIAYKLATALNNFTTCTYVTSRSISLRFINNDWIKYAEKCVEKLQNSSKNTELDTVSLFWLSLADFYLDCKKTTEAKVLLEKVKKMSNFKLIENSKIYIYAADIQLRNYFVINDNTSQEDYHKLLVEIHYMLINIHDLLEQETYRFWNIRFRLYALEQMYEVMCNMTMPMYSLLSYREIFAHLINGLQFAQKSCMTLRIAEYLKYYCYIFLLRGQTEEVETKLQDLEHILCLEKFQASMKFNHRQAANTVQAISTEPFRNANTAIMKNGGASPELKRKIFSMPNFLMDSNNCQCFTCTHLLYQYLTFSCAYIRAQLYSILGYVSEAEQHFHGASLIKERLEDRDTDVLRQDKKYKWKRHQTFDIDELLYMLDFSVFISDYVPERKDDALAVIEEALEIAKEVDLDKHPIGIYAKELWTQHYVYEVFADKLCISSEPEIEITITNQTASGCITPKQQVERAPRNQRRRKSPPAVAIPVITIAESPVTTEEPVVKPVPDEMVKSKRTKAKLVRRKLLVDEVDESPKDENQQPALIRKRSTRLASKNSGN